MARQTSLSADPNPIPFAAGAGTTTIHWDMGDDTPGEVWVEDHRGSRQLFARGSRGQQVADWIQPGGQYQFQLMQVGPKQKQRSSLSVTMGPPAASQENPPAGDARPASPAKNRLPTGPTPFILADPNPIPVAPGLGSTTMSWSTGDGTIGDVYLVTSTHDEVLFGQAAEASRPVTWIQRDISYEFRLYRSGDRTRPLAKTTVTMGNELHEKMRDLALVASVAAVSVAVGIGLVSVLRRLARFQRS